MISKTLFLILPGSVLAGFAVFTVLSYLLVPQRITIPLSLTIGILIFGLTKYYSMSTENDIRESELNTTSQNYAGTIVFVGLFISALLVVNIFPHNDNPGLFTEWQNINATNMIEVLSAIGICFFLPGYTIVSFLEREHRMKAPLKLLLAYLFSMLITGLLGYIGASFSYELSDRRILISCTSIVLLTLFVIQAVNRINRGSNDSIADSFSKALCLTRNNIIRKNSQIIVFGSLFLLVILSTYYLNNGKIVVDQWFYHGRAVLMNTPAYRDLSTAETYTDPYESKISDINQINPPFFSALLSAYFNLSGSPSVNSYVSINILNVMPIFAFYYFLSSWIHGRNQRAIIMATALFVLSSGFGWIYALYDSTLTGPLTTPAESIDLLSKTTDATYDVGTPTTFLDVGHPDITTPFIVIALPVGFTVLGLLGNIQTIYNGGNSTKNRSQLLWIGTTNIALIGFTLITLITLLGILAHDEFYLFIIICSTFILFRKSINKLNTTIFYTAFLFAIVLTIVVDFAISPIHYYNQRNILSVPLVLLCFSYVSASFALYLVKRKAMTASKLYFEKFTIKTTRALKKSLLAADWKSNREYLRRKLKTLLAIASASIIIYLYLFTFFVWTQVSVQDTLYYIKDQWNVPFYLYPMKYGLTLILGLAFVISYIFKKFEKELFIFAGIALIAFVAGPYYDEHRFGKYIMTSLDTLAAILLYKIISCSFFTKTKFRPLLTGLILSSVVIASGLSVLMFAGYVELLSTRPDYLEGGRRDFPTKSEFRMLDFLHDRVMNEKTYNIAVPEKEVDVNRGLVTKIYGFTGIPRVKLIQSPFTLNSSSIEGLYTSLSNTDTRYIMLPNEFITKNGGIISSPTPNTKVVKFASDNFPTAYQDSNYTVLEVPPLSAPSNKNSSVGLVYENRHHLIQDIKFENVTSEYNQYYYPLSILALANIRYDTFVEDDHTLFSKEYVLLPYDPILNNSYILSKYLEYVNAGGKLIVINSDENKIEGSFAKLLNIETGVENKFNLILPASQSGSMNSSLSNYISVSGVAQDLIVNSSNDISIKSYYVYRGNEDKDQKMAAPFSIEKTHGNGKIIFVNAGGYFNAIFKNSSNKENNDDGSYFLSLGKVLEVLNLGSEDLYRSNLISQKITSTPITRIVGDINIGAGQTVVFNSSSLSFPYSESSNKLYSYDMFVKQLTISNSSKIEISSNSSSKTEDYSDKTLQFKNENIIIKNIKLFGGPFEVSIISNGSKLPLQLPTFTSHHDYIGTSIPTGFDVKIKFPPTKSAYVEFDVTKIEGNNRIFQTLRVSQTEKLDSKGANNNSNSEIQLHNINTYPQQIKSISVLMKSPEMTIIKQQRHISDAQDGIENMAISFNEENHKNKPIEFKDGLGNITARFVYVDTYDTRNNTGIKTQFLSFLDNHVGIISDDGKNYIPARLVDSKNESKIKIPGDISEFAKLRGMQLPWIREIISNTSIVLAISVLIIISMVSRFWPKTVK
ncbi:MAG TPA: hypothetical protein VJS91_05620 [Nitrososphaeraceae archaeon]|nr:hypothetical protein [Nitrososphaeraceae archaeon]